MDDFSLASLKESRNEWCIQLIQKLSPAIVAGLATIFAESYKLCTSTNEQSKYLMTFQNFLARIPKWNTNIVETETKLIIESSGCAYLGDLLTCVHIIILKALTCVRVGIKQKKIDIDIPPLHKFIHSVYILVARKIYANIYLYEMKLSPLQTQQHNYQIEQIINECILNAVRDSIPVASILRSYLDETAETVDLSSDDTIKNKLEEVIKSADNSNIEIKLPVNAGDGGGGTGLGPGGEINGIVNVGFDALSNVGVNSISNTNELIAVPIINAVTNISQPSTPSVNMNAINEIAKSVSFEDNNELHIGEDISLGINDIESISHNIDGESIKLDIISL